VSGGLAGRVASAYGLGRSLWMYWGSPRQLARLRRFYGGLVRPGDLCFDIGAHVGNRTLTFAGLGARVVAVEPQPLFAGFLRRLCARRPAVTVLPVAVGAAPGMVDLVISRATPTVTTASAGFLEAVAAVPSFAWVKWDDRVAVPVTTLDALIATHGVPAFVKIDVEGMEPEVLAGLSRPLPLVSFEFVPAHRDAALRCVARLEALGRYRFNVSLGESMAWTFPAWQDAGAVAAWLAARPATGDSGDVYARLERAG
jgi:FkbM family methyltransferase